MRLRCLGQIKPHLHLLLTIFTKTCKGWLHYEMDTNGLARTQKVKIKKSILIKVITFNIKVINFNLKYITFNGSINKG